MPGGGRHWPDSFTCKTRPILGVRAREAYFRDDAIFKNIHTHMHAGFCRVLSSFNLVKLFQLCQGVCPE